MRRPEILLSLAIAGLCIGTSTPASAAGEQTVSLEALMEAGREHHPTMAKEPLLAESLELQRARINKAYWPQLSLGGQASWQSDVTHVEVSIPGVTIDAPPKDQYKITLDLTQSIWDGGITANQKRVAVQRTRVEQHRVDVEWYQIRDRILQTYFAGIVQQELKEQAEVLERHLGDVVTDVQLARDKGIATERDVLLAQARQLEARQAIADAESQLASVRRSLEHLTGTPLGDDAMLATPAGECGDDGLDSHEPEFANRPELSLIAEQRQLLVAQDKLERAADLPHIGAFATGGYGRPGLNFLNTDFQFYFIGGVRLTVPLTHLYTGRWRNRRKQLAVQQALLDREHDAATTQMSLAQDAQLAERDRLERALEVDEELVDIRERARKQTELQVSLGTATMTDLIQDLTLEDQARSRRAIHRAQGNLACHQLAFIKGDL